MAAPQLTLVSACCSHHRTVPQKSGAAPSNPCKYRHRGQSKQVALPQAKASMLRQGCKTRRQLPRRGNSLMVTTGWS